MKITKRVTATVLALFATCPTSFSATTIYSDTFSVGNGAIEGRSPEVSNGVPGATYIRHNSFWITDIQGSRLRIGADSGVSIDIASAGAFVQPTVMSIS